jgi:hypothetical protein
VFDLVRAHVHAPGDGRRDDAQEQRAPDLSRSRIYYTGQSFGIYGVELLGLESTIRAGVPNVAGGPIVEIARLSPAPPLVGIADHAQAVALQRRA